MTVIKTLKIVTRTLQVMIEVLKIKMGFKVFLRFSNLTILLSDVLDCFTGKRFEEITTEKVNVKDFVY